MKVRPSHLILLALALCSQTVAAAAPKMIAVRAKAYINADGERVDDVVLLVEDGKIKAIGSDVEVPKGCPVLDRSNHVLSPGLVDVHVTLGTMGRTAETAQSIESEADAAELFNRFHHDFDRAVRAGITTVLLAPSSSHLVGGSTAAVKTAGSDTARRIVGSGPLKLSFRDQAFTLARTPTSLQGAWDDLRRLIAKAKEARPGKQETSDAFRRWASGRTAAIVDVDSAAALGSLSRFAVEQEVRCIALHAYFAAERLDDVATLEQPVILGTYSFGQSRRYTRVPAVLHERGIAFAFTSNAPGWAPEQLRLSAAISVKQGLPAPAAVAAMTTTPAMIAGVADRVGSLQVGRDADFLVLSGDPVDLTTTVHEVFVDGERVFKAGGGS